MEELKIINERTSWLQMFLVVTALLLVAVVLLNSEEYYEFWLGVIAVLTFIYLGYNWIMRWRDKSVLAVYAALKIPIFEVPVRYRGRSTAQGKKIRLSDAFEAFWVLLKERFR